MVVIIPTEKMKMRTLYQFVEEAMEINNLREVEIARKLDISKQRLHTLKKRRDGNLPPESISNLADLLSIDPIVIHAAMMYNQSEKQKTRDYWRELPSRVLLAGFGQIASA